MANPLRDLCPRVVVVWRAERARCSVCNRTVTRTTVGHAWRHARVERYAPAHLLEEDIERALTEELDRLVDPADPTGYVVVDERFELEGAALERYRELVELGTIRLPAIEQVGRLAARHLSDGALAYRFAVDAALGVDLDPGIEAIVGLASRTAGVDPAEARKAAGTIIHAYPTTDTEEL